MIVRNGVVFPATYVRKLALLGMLIVCVGCSEDGIPLTPNGNAYDSAQLALIPAGTFRIGNLTFHPSGDSDEVPVHDVTLTRPFLIGRTEVTQAQYETVMGANPSRFSGGDRPVDMVTWYDAVAFCNAFSIREGLTPCYTGSGNDIVCDFSANGYRLPTEAEWEYACRGGAETDFYTGNMTQPEAVPLDPSMVQAGWYEGNAGDSTHQVGQKKPNAFGLYDMHGNVCEWCWDRYGDYASTPVSDPRGPTEGQYRVQRGGSWMDGAMGCRSAERSHRRPENPSSVYGFRVVRSYH